MLLQLYLRVRAEYRINFVTSPRAKATARKLLSAGPLVAGRPLSASDGGLLVRERATATDDLGAGALASAGARLGAGTRQRRRRGPAMLAESRTDSAPYGSL